ncbi:hypothetical protein BIW11_04442 [Tropilaelaps mercedesae]|uniref:Uncharacterized protein n=1 Tax=Tropilaelaps mercedesae TaxID=418985 RepID=A0A1V9X6N6_9ACAR|nr:hypothetical protein BIW11_04442 [Tropilaelaps mercedesae]
MRRTPTSSPSACASSGGEEPSPAARQVAPVGGPGRPGRRIEIPKALVPVRRAMVGEGTSLDDDFTEEERTAKRTQIAVHQSRGPRTSVLLPMKVAWDKMSELLMEEIYTFLSSSSDGRSADFNNDRGDENQLRRAPDEIGRYPYLQM